MGKLNYINDREGYEYISDAGINYSLYELTALGGKSTSDIVFIMNDQYCDYEINDEVGYFYGASFISDPDYQNEYIDMIDKIISDYEKNNPKVVNLIKSKGDKHELLHSNDK